MIRVIVQHIDADGEQRELAQMRIDRIEPTFEEAESADYQFQLTADNGSDILIRNRVVEGFPRKTVNVLGLIRLALMTLKSEDYQLVGDTAVDSARRQRRYLRSIPRGQG